MLLVEKKTLFKFVSVFVGLNTLFLVTLSIFYYNYQKNEYLDFLQNEMLNYAETASESIYELDDINRLDDFLLHDDRFDVEVVDKKNVVIYPQDNHFNMKFQKGFFRSNGYYYYVKSLELDQIKDIHYLVLRSETIDPQLEQTKKSIYLVLFLSIPFFAIMIFVLSRIFLTPLREYIEFLDRFIRDATHELNTPISILSMSLERIEQNELSAKNTKAFSRMLVATRTMSHLFDDLSFIMLAQKSSVSTQVNVKELVLQRISFFLPLAEAKQIELIEDLQECELLVNEGDLSRIIDNLLSNAIKYNKINGRLTIKLDTNILSVADTGIGFDPAKSSEIFGRFTRLESANGGFGLGLNIVKSLCDLYEIAIDVQTKINEGTTFILSWKSSRIIHTS